MADLSRPQPPLNIEKPTLLLDRQRVLKNIERMATKVRASNVRFRPHFKTHRSAAIGEWFRPFGVEAITVSCVDLAAYFARSGWKDITIAFPVNVLEIQRINTLASQTRLGLLVESPEAIEFLSRHLTSKADAWIKVDTGYGRTGVAWNQPDEIIRLAGAMQGIWNLSFQGLLAHAGHTYHATAKEQVRSIYQDSLSMLKRAQQSLVAAGFPKVQLSIGDTPGCSLVDDLGGVDEVRPGNFVFYDIKQLGIGSCSERDLAVAVACPVVAKHKERHEIILYGGAVHLSKDFTVAEDGGRVFGRVCLWEKQGWGPILGGTYVSSLSQEHGVVKTTDQWFERIQVGDSVVVLPVHSCLLSYLLKEYHALDGEILSSESAVCTPA